MKRIAGILLLALVVVGLCASGAQASPSRGDNCASCHMSASAGSDRTVNGGAAVTLDGSNSGYDQSSNTINSYAWTQTAGTPAVTLTGANTSRATFTAPTVSAQARLTFQLAVTDLVANVTTTKTDTVVITVNPTTTNRPPVANAGADRAVTAGTGVTLSGSASSDPDGGTLTYAWAQSAGTGVTLANAGTVSATFTAPNVTAATPLTFQLTVRDSGNLTSTDTIVVTVNPAATNRPPVANAGADRAVTAGAAVTLSGSGSSDPDGGTLSYAWAQTAGTGVTLANAGTVTATFAAPSVTAATPLTFQLTVRDSGSLTSTDTIVVTVNPSTTPANRPPTASAGLDLAVLPGTLNTLDGFYSSDPDAGDGIASCAWTQTGGPAVALSNPAALNPIFQAPTSPTTLTFRLLVADNGGLQDDDTVTVVVLSSTGGTPPPPPPAVNQPPVANAGPDQSVRSSATVRLTGAASRDPDAGDAIASYRWRQTGGTSVRLSSTSSVGPSFTAPRVSRSTTLTFQLTVTDRAGLSSTDTMRVTVSRSRSDDDD